MATPKGSTFPTTNKLFAHGLGGDGQNSFEGSSNLFIYTHRTGLFGLFN